jgi:hypothetical protein
MASTTRQFTFPDEKFRLEEINMPQEMAAPLAGRTVAVEVPPEVPPRTLRIDLDNPPAVGVSVLLDDYGTSILGFAHDRVVGSTFLVGPNQTIKRGQLRISKSPGERQEVPHAELDGWLHAGVTADRSGHIAAGAEGGAGAGGSGPRARLPASDPGGQRPGVRFESSGPTAHT